MKRWMILALTVFGIAAVFAGELADAIQQAGFWINKKYTYPPAREEEEAKLTAIRKSSLSEAEKIAAIRMTFPEAFRQPLIFQQPLSWRIHSLALGYDIKTSVREKEEVKDILDTLEKFERKDTIGGSTAITGTVNRKSSRRGEATGGGGFSWNPFQWKANLHADISGRLAGEYSTGTKAEKQSSELWSASRQATFARERQRIRELIRQTTVTNQHLSFTVTFTNHSREPMTCDLRNAYIPIYTGNETCGRAKPLDPGVVRIESGVSQDIFFRMELDTTTALRLVDFMSSASPTIDPLKGSNLPITSISYPNGVISASLRNVETRPFDIRLPGFAAHWEIRRRHAAAARETTLRDALIAADEDIFTGIGYHICKWGGNNELTALSEVPLGKFAPTDSEKRYWVFIRCGNRTVSTLSAGELDSPLPASGCTLWIVDLENLEDYKDSSSLLQEAIFAKVIADAEKGDARAQFRVAYMLSQGFGTIQNLSETVEWYRKAAEVFWLRKAAVQGYTKAQQALRDLGESW